jgi:uncharacterized protein
VTALGCTIGQGISGVSTLAIGSIIALASIIAGCVVAVKYQAWRIERADDVPVAPTGTAGASGIVSG